jgi:hypothetical protein
MTKLKGSEVAPSREEISSATKTLSCKKIAYRLYLSAFVLVLLLFLTVPFGLWLIRFAFDRDAGPDGWLGPGFLVLIAILPTASAVIACYQIAQAGT